MFLYTALFLGILLGRTFGSVDEQIPKCDFILSYKYSNYLMEWLVTYICNHIECYLTPEMTQIKPDISLTVLSYLIICIILCECQAASLVHAHLLLE